MSNAFGAFVVLTLIGIATSDGTFSLAGAVLIFAAAYFKPKETP